MDDKVLKRLSETSLYEKIKKIRNIYNNLEKRQIKFCNEFNIHCVDGCGQCCEHFTPDITEIEALFLAYGLIRENKDQEILDLLNSKEESDTFCPLYKKDSQYHCSVYKWRPLICRLFGATASKDKNGNPTFRKCKWNYNGHDISKKEFEKNKKAVILMSDFGTAIEEIEPGETQTLLLREALELAVNKIRYILDLEEQMSKTND